MIRRFRKIYTEFGALSLAQTVLLMVGLILMGLCGVFLTDDYTAAIIAATSLPIGYLLRGLISDGIEYYRMGIPAGLLVYCVVRAVGHWLGMSHETDLLIITATTAVLFNLDFWAYSDPLTVSADNPKYRNG